jgi:uncharacterized protein YqjF (DUF2071 family)
MKQVWRDLLFAHWPVALDVLRPLVPEALPVDTFEGRAWITIAPFHMEIRPRSLPALPGLSRIPELNCRTYVTMDGKPGVYFFSLDITSRAAVLGAHTFYHLPYFHADMRVEKSGETISYSSSRRGEATWRATYGPISDAVRQAAPGTIDYWLTERYCLYTVHCGRVYRGDIHHFPWPLQQARAEIYENTIAEAAGIALPGPPAILSFARELEVLIWWPEAVGRPLIFRGCDGFERSGD